MKRKFLGLLLALSTLSLASACGSGGSDSGNAGSCDFEISSILNGANLGTANSRWVCGATGVFGTFAIFEDGSGASIATTGVTAFSWEKTGCDEISYSGTSISTGNSFSGTASDIQGSTASQTLTFTDEEKGIIHHVACHLVSGS